MNLTRLSEIVRHTGTLGAVGVLLTAGIFANAANATTSPSAAQTANERFWSTLHSADYAGYPAALAAVEAALAESPEDPVQVAHLGWLHMWHLAEAASFATSAQDRAADLKSAAEYFKQAVRLAPKEARYLGFYATTLFFDSALASDAAGMQRAEATMDRAVRMWPEFNLFTAGYIHSSDPYDSPEYATAMQRMWRNVDVCTGQHVSREHPQFVQYPAMATTVGPKRACWNSSIAPHNFEGFFLNFGDMLVKKGDVALARQMYANARLSKTYEDWVYRPVLERRITDAESNVDVFRDSASSGKSDAHMMVQSDFSCMACHRR
jgi:tetratricopeptide (TPR) repeat protein